MAYSAVPVVTTGDLWTAANHNTYLRDNMAAGAPDVFTAKGQLPVATAADAMTVLAVGSNGQVLVADSAQASGMKWAGVAGQARYRANADQTASNTTPKRIDFASQDYDPDSLVTIGASWKYEVPATGYYLICCTVNTDASAGWAAGEEAYLQVYGGAAGSTAGAILARMVMHATGTYGVCLTGAAIVSATAGDDLNVRLYQNSGGNVTIDGTVEYTHIAIMRVF